MNLVVGEHPALAGFSVGALFPNGPLPAHPAADVGVRDLSRRAECRSRCEDVEPAGLAMTATECAATASPIAACAVISPIRWLLSYAKKVSLPELFFLAG
jgi:hypothetical protein